MEATSKPITNAHRIFALFIQKTSTSESSALSTLKGMNSDSVGSQ